MPAKKRSRRPRAGKRAEDFVAVAQAASPPEREGWRVPVVYGVFFFPLLLACSPVLGSKFALPKLIVLGAGVLALSLVLLARNGTLTSAPRSSMILPLALGIWWVVSTPFAMHVPTALHGEYDYYNGLWVHLCWLVLFVASLAIPADGSTVRRIVTLLVAAVVPVAAINLSEASGLSNLGLGEVSTLGDRVAAGALMNLAAPLVAIALVRSRSSPARAGLALVIVLLVSSEIVSQGRGAWMGLLAALVVLAVGMARSRVAWMASFAAIMAVAVLAGVLAAMNPVVAERLATLTRLPQDRALGARLTYYGAALRATIEHPVAGIGFENFRNSYPSYRSADPDFFENVIPTMVHDRYLEIALNNGVPSLLLYLALLGVVLTALVRRIRREQNRDHRDLLLGLLAVLAACLVQDTTGWLDIGVASLFWIALGLAANIAGRDGPQVPARLRRAVLLAVSGCGVVLSLYLLSDAYARIAADASLYRAQALDVSTEWRAAESLVAAALRSLPEDARTEMIAGQIHGQRFLATRDPAAFSRANSLLQSSYRHNPFDRLRLFNIVVLETAALDFGVIGKPSGFAQDAISQLAKTDSDNPRFHGSKARFLAAQGRFAEALAAIREARHLAPEEASLAATEAEYRARIR